MEHSIFYIDVQVNSAQSLSLDGWPVKVITAAVLRGKHGVGKAFLSKQASEGVQQVRHCRQYLTARDQNVFCRSIVRQAVGFQYGNAISKLRVAFSRGSNAFHGRFIYKLMHGWHPPHSALNPCSAPASLIRISPYVIRSLTLYGISYDLVNAYFHLGTAPSWRPSGLNLRLQTVRYQIDKLYYTTHRRPSTNFATHQQFERPIRLDICPVFGL